MNKKLILKNKKNELIYFVKVKQIHNFLFQKLIKIFKIFIKKRKKS